MAACLKYADNVIKNFASSVAMIVGGVVSIVAFQFPLSMGFVLGGVMVLIAVPIYDPIVGALLCRYLSTLV